MIPQVREPRKVASAEGDLQPGQQLTRTVNAENFTMRTVVCVEKNCVLTSEHVNWFDPVSGNDRSTHKNEIFFTGADDV